MGILIGMDEAGYGPNFGPLVVAATAWEVADEGLGFGVQSSRRSDLGQANGTLRGGTAMAKRSAKRSSTHDCVDLYRLLRNIIVKSASERRLAIADSKVLYHPGLGLRQLERGVHAVLLAMRESAGCWSSMVRCCGADPDGHHPRFCWPDGFDCSLPIDAAIDELVRLAARFSRACDSASVRPILVRARLVYPAQFNELVAYYGTKGAVLSHITVGLLRELIDAVCAVAEATSPPPAPGSTELSAGGPQPPIYAVCDKHGGRNYYAALLQHHFSEHWVEPVYESHAESRYEWGPPESRVRVNFRMNGERFLPTALASMTAKYLRELAMRAFNEFWAARVPDLKPTAGYPRDSHRFRNAIRSAQRALRIDDYVLWRER